MQKREERAVSENLATEVRNSILFIAVETLSVSIQHLAHEVQTCSHLTAFDKYSSSCITQFVRISQNNNGPNHFFHTILPLWAETLHRVRKHELFESFSIRNVT
jgi:hypothetical protein